LSIQYLILGGVGLAEEVSLLRILGGWWLMVLIYIYIYIWTGTWLWDVTFRDRFRRLFDLSKNHWTFEAELFRLGWGEGVQAW